jgi:hypothetical protein
MAVNGIDENTIWTENVIGCQIVIVTASEKTEIVTGTTESETARSTSMSPSVSKPSHALKPTDQVYITALQSTQLIIDDIVYRSF